MGGSKSKSGKLLKPFNYLKYLPIKKQWFLFIQEDMDRRMAELEKIYLERYKELSKNSRTGKFKVSLVPSSEEWISSDEVIELILNTFDHPDKKALENDDDGDNDGNDDDDNDSDEENKKDKKGEKSSPALFNTPRLESSSSDVMTTALTLISQNCLKGYNTTCRNHRKEIISPIHCASYINAVHGLKRGKIMMQEIDKTVERLGEMECEKKASRPPRRPPVRKNVSRRPPVEVLENAQQVEQIQNTSIDG